MKELSIEEKACRYDEAIERAKKWCNAPNIDKMPTYGNRIIEEIFPELKESEDERLRKEMLQIAKESEDTFYMVMTPNKREKLIAWLEKQGEQKPTDKVEPKFKVGDWIILNGLTLYIKEVVKGYYRTISKGGITNSYDWDIDNVARLWTIQDAKDGDVLALISGQSIFLFDGYDKEYCHYSKLTNSFSPNFNYIGFIQHQFVPATKEQRDILFAKMKEAGYVWDAEKKELKKIENEIEIPFGAKDSELQKVSYHIPEGFHAEIEGNRVVIKRGEQKSAWSEDDEKILKEIITDVRFEGYNNDLQANSYRKIRWLKSLIPQNRWKPSDEQMEALKKECIANSNYQLCRLYDQLKEF